MRVDDRGVREVDPVVERRDPVVQQTEQPVGAVDVEPGAELMRDLTGATNGIDRAGVRCSRGGHDRDRYDPRGDVVLERAAQQVDPHRWLSSVAIARTLERPMPRTAADRWTV